MEVTLYTNFRKRHNSTKQPTDGGTTKDLKLKDNCSKINPMFFIADVEGYTYLKAWGNYYFIDNASVDINGAQYISCSLDYLATYKTPILNSSAFIKYSSSDYSSLLHDDRVAPLVSTRVGITTADSIFHTDESYIITVVNDEGLVNYYTGMYVNQLIQALMSKTDSWYESMITSLSDALSSIVAIRAVPIMDMSTAGTKQVKVGTLDLEIGKYPVLPDIRPGYVIGAEYLYFDRIYNDFRKSSQYTSIRLYLPFVGIVELSADDFLNSEGVSVTTHANALTGSVIYRVGNDNGDYVGTYNGTFGREIPISNVNFSNITSGIGQLVGSLVQGGAGYGAIMGGISAVDSVPSMVGFAETAAAIGATPKMVGGGIALGTAVLGGVSAFMKMNQHSSTFIGGYSGGYGEFVNNKLYLMVDEQPTRIEPSNLTELYGRPCLKVRQLQGLSGYVETIGFSLEVAAMDTVRTTINSMLDSGIYIE